MKKKLKFWPSQTPTIHPSWFTAYIAFCAVLWLVEGTVTNSNTFEADGLFIDVIHKPSMVTVLQGLQHSMLQ